MNNYLILQKYTFYSNIVLQNEMLFFKEYNYSILFAIN